MNYFLIVLGQICENSTECTQCKVRTGVDSPYDYYRLSKNKKSCENECPQFEGINTNLDSK